MTHFFVILDAQGHLVAAPDGRTRFLSGDEALLYAVQLPRYEIVECITRAIHYPPKG